MRKKDLPAEDRAQLDRLIAALKSEGEAIALFDEDNTAAIDGFRELGRRAGRELRWKIRTHATDPAARPDRCVAVWVVVEESSPLRDQLQQIRMRKALNKLWEKIKPD